MNYEYAGNKKWNVYDEGNLVATVETKQGERLDEYAALFSAAPDLLAALGHLVGVCEGRTLPNEKHPAVVQARDAIAKAKGSAS